MERLFCPMFFTTVVGHFILTCVVQDGQISWPVVRIGTCSLKGLLLKP